MKKSSRTTNGHKAKNSSSYERDMEKSFAVIYHNLKRIQDEKPLHEGPRRRHSVPQIPNPALLQRHEPPEQSAADQSAETTALPPKPRRVSFCDSVTHTTFSSRSAILEISGSRPVEQVCNFPERDRDKDTSSQMF